MNQVCQEQLEEWIQRRLHVFCETQQSFDPTQEMLLLTLSIICEAAFEYKIGQDEAELFLHELDLALTEFTLKQSSDPFREYFGYLYAFGEIRRAEKASRNIQALPQKILQAYRTRHHPTTTSSTSTDSNNNSGTVMERIVANPNYKNDQERIADIIVFLIGGHETTAYSIAWTLLELARHLHLTQEARHLLQLLPTEDERLKSPTLDHLIKESMRLHPVAAFGGSRKAHRDFRVDDNTIIPKGSIVWIITLLLHRNPQYFDRPDDFDPDRWKTNCNTDASAFMPFLTGARNCIGQSLATVELHTVILRLLMDFEFEVEDPGKPDMALTMKPSGLLLKATKI